MRILHLAYSGDSLYLWGEASFESAEPTHGDAPPLPWGVAREELLAALKAMGARPLPKLEAAAAELSLLLPSKDGVPLPSSPILGDAPSSCAELELRPFRAPALAVAFQQVSALPQIEKDSGEGMPAPGVLLADDFRYVCRAFEYAAAFVRRGAYLPDLVLLDDGSYVSRWRPMVLAKWLDEFSSFINAMPAVLCGVSAGGAQGGLRKRREVAEELLEWLVDSMVRSSIKPASGAGGRAGARTPHEIWMRSLMGKDASLSQWQDEMDEFYPQVREWAASHKPVTASEWRLFLRVEEPAELELEEPPAGDEDEPAADEAEEPPSDNGDERAADEAGEQAAAGGLWRITWHLQSAQDPTLIIPAQRVWSPGDAERECFGRAHTNPRRYMLQALGRLAARVPVFAKSLEEAAPCECRLDSVELFDFLENHAAAIIDSGISLQLPKEWGSLSQRPRLALRAEVHEASGFSTKGNLSLNDLLDVDWSVALGDDELTMEELEALAELKAPLANVRGRWVVVYREEVEKILAALKKAPAQMERRDALLSSIREDYGDAPVSGVEGSPWLASVRELLAGSRPLEEMAAPDGFCGSLRPYQAKGLFWMSRRTQLGLGACLADDMGLGKTVQTLALIQGARAKGERRPILLVCPTSVMENWRREAQKFTPELNVIIHHGARRARALQSREALEGALVVTSYSLLHRDVQAFGEIEWAGVILDEAQNIKNPDTRQAKAARAIAAGWRVALTGTPVENHVGDLWSLMEFLVPGLMPNRARFAREILRPVQSGSEAAMERVRRMTAPFILRRLKTDKSIISDLPEKIETKEFCALCREQASLYEAVTAQLETSLNGAEGIQRKGMVLATIMALKQICDHPMLYAKDKAGIGNRSGKMARLAELAEEMLGSGDRALIFTQYAEMGAILKTFLQETFGREALFLHGGVAREKRDEMVRRFQEEEKAPPFFILSLKAGGTGLTLTRASHVVMFDRWWNPAVEQQAVDRAYRIGQRSNVQVHYFCCRGTLEEKIDALIESKKEMASMLVGTGENWLAELGDSDLKELFALEKGAVESL